MAIKTIDALVDGGKATPGPPLGPSLAPLKMNIGEIVADVKTIFEGEKGSIYIGKEVGHNSKGDNNVFVGNSAGYENMKGNYNLFLGHSAGYHNQGGSRNIFM